MTHTEGPWHYAGPSDIGRDSYSIYGSGPLAYTAGPSDYGDAAEANARLIASAPELLVALGVALTADECPCCGRDNTGHDKCTSDDCPGVQAIAKATQEVRA